MPGVILCNLHFAISMHGCQHVGIFVLDSKFNYSLSVQTEQICALLNCQNKFITVIAVPVQQQTRGVNCSLFAIACVQYILTEKKNPIDVSFSQSSRRNHALKCLKNDNLEMFPQSKNSPIKRSKEKIIQLAIFVYVDRFERSLTIVYSKGKF